MSLRCHHVNPQNDSSRGGISAPRGLFQLQGDAAERGEVEKDGLLVRFEWDKHPVPPQGRLGYQRATIVFPDWHFGLPCLCF